MSEHQTLATAAARAQDDGPSIGVSFDGRTHYAHTRYAAGDDAGVIWFDPRDGRENFATGRGSDDLEAVGEAVVTGCAIRPFRPTTHGDPAKQYVVKRHRTELKRFNDDRDGYESYERPVASVRSVICDSLADARAWCREHVPGYATADWRDAVTTRADVEVRDDD